MTERLGNRVRPGFYLDSVALMRLSAELSARPGVEEAVLMMGTEANRVLLAEAGLLAASSREAGPNDLILAVRASGDADVEALLDEAARGLQDRSEARAAESGAASLESAAAELAGANLALVSVPGEHAAREARRALARDLNVLIFSDHVSLEDEVALKREAERRGLLVMGPDCGSAIIAGVPLAFANAVPRGRVGIVAASGTGLQEVATLLARAGEGVSHAIGVGGRDLSDPIGGSSTLRALELLAGDRQTERVALISKPPGPHTAERIFARLADYPKPAAACLLGLRAGEGPAGLALAATLEALVEALLERPLGEADRALPGAAGGDRRWVHGLYTGGTLCAEAQVLFAAAGLPVFSNVPLDAARVGPPDRHRIIDLGADEHTLGRAHPMIEPSARAPTLAESLADPTVAVVLLDVMLGYGAHPDPAAAIVRCLEAVPEERPLAIGSVCGTERDPQVRSRQVRALEAAGMIVASSNAAAVRLALRAVSR